MPGARTTHPGHSDHNFPASYPDMSKVFCVRIPFQNLKAAPAAFWKGIRTQNTVQGNPMIHATTAVTFSLTTFSLASAGHLV